MKNQLSVTSRILVAFASGALIAVYFLPAWRIDLFAPQYPEGLSMYIWINKLTGDVDIINGLNHYIGMKHISAEMFPEFKFLPYVVAFFILLGMTAAVTGKRKLLFVYVLLTVIGAMFVPYDLYQWGYDYGHNLNPEAAIQVPGLTYQPPVFGHKRLLNFDAYSFPDIAGWIVAGAGFLAGLVWFTEWFRNRKRKSRKNITLLSTAGTFLFLFSSCTAKPEPFVIGKDSCFECKMGIADLKFGGEIVTKKGKIYKFDDAGCMLNFLKSGVTAEKDISLKLIMNYEKPNTFLDADKTFFLVSPEIKSPMNSHIAGFVTSEAAEKRNNNKTGKIINWDNLIKKEE